MSEDEFRFPFVMAFAGASPDELSRRMRAGDVAERDRLTVAFALVSNVEYRLMVAILRERWKDIRETHPTLTPESFHDFLATDDPAAPVINNAWAHVRRVALSILRSY